MHRLIPIWFAIGGALLSSFVSAGESPALALEGAIPLGDVKGRIDHLAVDLARQRLFVAELGNDTVGVIDLRTGTVRRRITGLDGPQGLAYLYSTDTLYVANGRDGSVALFAGDNLKPAATMKLRSDADNVRVDPRTSTLFVGYGDGAIAVIDPDARSKVRDIALDGHPESFQFAASNGRIYINVPDARQIVIADGLRGRVIKRIPAGKLRSNFPMALDEAGQRLLVAFRDPPILRTMTLGGKFLADAEICGDADDVFADYKRHRVYVICGQGVIDVLNDNGSRIERVATAAGARTGLFVPELDRLFVAAPARDGRKAEIRVFRPQMVSADAVSDTKENGL